MNVLATANSVWCGASALTINRRRTEEFIAIPPCASGTVTRGEDYQFRPAGAPCQGKIWSHCGIGPVLARMPNARAQ